VVIGVRDACDPATFNAAVGPGTCIRPDNSNRFVAFPDFIARVTERGAHNAWSFDRDNVTVRPGESVLVRRDRGGEFHTFTKVDEFPTVGCAPPLNMILFGSPALGPLCTPAILGSTGIVPPGFSLVVSDHSGGVNQLTPGVNRFQCLIHPWMQSTITLRS
jgi:hypothetical protein